MTNSAAKPSDSFPNASISNGIIKVQFYLPDAKNGYYRSTRFDWSGAIYSIQYKGHEFCGKWYDRVDPKIINWVFQGPEIVAGPCSALYGPVDEFETTLGYNDNNQAGTFIKIGIGVLKKVGGSYNKYFPYEVLNSGKWTVQTGKDSVEFIQELSDPNSGYAYVYRKVVKLVNGKPGLVIFHSLRNTGQKAIKSSVYNHNFITIDNQPTGPDLSFSVPFKINVTQAAKKELAEVLGNKVVYNKQLSGEDEAVIIFDGFSENVKDTEMIIENRKAGAGMKVTGDRPLIRDLIWSLRSVFAVEPFIAIDIQPGSEFTWNNIYDYYTLK